MLTASKYLFLYFYTCCSLTKYFLQAPEKSRVNFVKVTQFSLKPKEMAKRIDQR